MDPSTLPRPVGFVLGGGGSLGAIQAGMLRAVAEQRIIPDLIVGTSVGALNGAVVALDPDGAASTLAQAWARMTREVIFPGGLLAQARTLQRSRTHLFPNTGLAAVITGFLGTVATFSDLTLPLGASESRFPVGPAGEQQSGRVGQGPGDSDQLALSA